MSVRESVTNAIQHGNKLDQGKKVISASRLPGPPGDYG